MWILLDEIRTISVILMPLRVDRLIIGLLGIGFHRSIYAQFVKTHHGNVKSKAVKW